MGAAEWYCLQVFISILMLLNSVTLNLMLEPKSNLHFLQIANSDKPKWSNSTTLVAVLVLNELLCLFGVVKCTRMFGLWLRVLEFSM